ncbi:MAG: gliding motility-associated C-terminal domain-containing protein [Saprospiraceae bacterium]
MKSIFSKLSPLLFLLVCHHATQAQTEFFTNGSARAVNDSCFVLTNDVLWEVGSIWYPDKIDLRNDFDLVMTMNFGSNDLMGADGIVFGLQPVSTTIGMAGGGIGFENISPALGVEFDTYQNFNNGDPSFDHVAILRNGNNNHGSPNNLAGPVQALVNSPNVETGNFIDLRVTWKAGAQTLTVYFGCDERLTYTGDIINEIFNGDPFVFYGFTSATGGFANKQEICFTFNSFLEQLPDEIRVCPGGQVFLDVGGGVRYEWTPGAGLSDSLANNVTIAPDSTTLYTVAVFDDCDLPRFDDVLITVTGDSAFIDLGPDTTLCDGDALNFDITVPTATYDWIVPDNDAAGPRYTATGPGLYEVTATRTDIICTTSDRVRLNYRPQPQLDLRGDTTICEGQLVELIASFPEAVSRWIGGPDSDTIYVSQAGRYTAILEHPCGTLTDFIDVSVDDCRQVYLPSAFTPNADGLNDFFAPLDGGDILRVNSFRVFNRWGGLVYTASDLPRNDLNSGWDGRDLNGKPQPAGVYVYEASITFIDGSTLPFQGSVVLVR